MNNELSLALQSSNEIDLLLVMNMINVKQTNTRLCLKKINLKAIRGAVVASSVKNVICLNY